MNLKGKIHEIGETQEVSGTFKKRQVIVEYAENPTYPEFIAMEMQQDKTSVLNDYQVGQEVDVDFNLRGRPWTNKEGKTTYFNTLVIWKIAKIGSAPSAVAQPTSNNSAGAGAGDDLPF